MFELGGCDRRCIGGLRVGGKESLNRPCGFGEQRFDFFGGPD